MPSWWSLVDTLSSEGSARKGVGVQVPPTAHSEVRNSNVKVSL